MRLADEFGVSMTPVRDCLNQLVGEGLVELTPGEGFRVAFLTEQVLRDMLRLNRLLLEEAIKIGEPNVALDKEQRPYATYAGRLATIFSNLASGADNRILGYVVGRLNDRLYLVRSRESEILPNAGELMEKLEKSIDASTAGRLEALTRYTEECLANVSRLIATLKT